MIACDLGSNTFRAVWVECETKRKIADFERIVKTADGLQKSGEISKDAITRIVKAINEAKEFMDFKKDRVVAVATAALRMASNRDKVLSIIKKETGVEFEVITGTQEANYTAFAVSEALKKLKQKSDDFILLDLGGASSELYIKKADRAFIKSFDIGIVTLTQKYENFEGVKNSIENETAEIKNFIDEIYELFSKPKIFVSTAGTATTLASFKLGLDYEHYDASRINGVMLNEKEIREISSKLFKMEQKERERWVGVGRYDLIFSGITILLEILKISNFSEIIVINDGLREGVALQYCLDKA